MILGMAGTSHLPTRRGFRRGLKELLFSLRTEAHTPWLQGLSVGAGVFIGCLPIYGLHLAACVIVNRLFRLNLIKMYLATNINNPFSAPFLVYAELQIGALVRHGAFYQHTLETARTIRLREVVLEIVVGSMTVGVVCGVVFAALTFLLVRRINNHSEMSGLVEETGQRYLEIGLHYWEYSRARLRFDPFFRHLLGSNVLPIRGSLVHIGCGYGLLLSLLDVAANAEPGGSLVLGGVDDNPKKIEVARRVLKDRAQVVCQKIDQHDFGTADVIVNLDQLKSVDRSVRETVLEKAARSVAPGGLLIVRVSTSRSRRMWPSLSGLSELRVVSVLERVQPGFSTTELYRSVRNVVILARRRKAEES